MSQTHAAGDVSLGLWHTMCISSLVALVECLFSFLMLASQFMPGMSLPETLLGLFVQQSQETKVVPCPFGSSVVEMWHDLAFSG